MTIREIVAKLRTLQELLTECGKGFTSSLNTCDGARGILKGASVAYDRASGLIAGLADEIEEEEA